MTEFEFSPYTKIVIKQLLKYSFTDFIQVRTDGHPGVANWAGGVVFSFSTPKVQSPEILHDSLKEGILYWEIVEYAKMDEYRAIEINPNNNLQLRIIKSDQNTIFLEFAHWLQKEGYLEKSRFAE